MCLGNASRKALAAGLHKNTRFKIEQTMEDAEEKRLTFWCLFFYDMLVCSLFLSSFQHFVRNNKRLMDHVFIDGFALALVVR